jgi:serine/threonine protein kinase
MMWLEAHIMLHLKFCASAMVQKQMFGVLEWWFISSYVGYLHFGLVRIFWCPLLLRYIHNVLSNLISCSCSFFDYDIEKEHDIFEEVLHGHLDFTSNPWPKVSASAKDLIRRMLVRDPKKRLTAHEVLCKLWCIFSISLIFLNPAFYHWNIYEIAELIGLIVGQDPCR